MTNPAQDEFEPGDLVRVKLASWVYLAIVEAYFEGYLKVRQVDNLDHARWVSPSWVELVQRAN